jgi:hypothetical protein
MQSHTLTCVALLAALVALSVLPASRVVQTCTQKFSDLKTCTLFNGQFVTGGPTSLDKTKLIEETLMEGYDNHQEIRKNDECKALYLTVGCIGAVSHPDFPAADPCSSHGARLKMCKGRAWSTYRCRSTHIHGRAGGLYHGRAVKHEHRVKEHNVQDEEEDVQEHECLLDTTNQISVSTLDVGSDVSTQNSVCTCNLTITNHCS